MDRNSNLTLAAASLIIFLAAALAASAESYRGLNLDQNQGQNQDRNQDRYQNRYQDQNLYSNRDQGQQQNQYGNQYRNQDQYQQRQTRLQGRIQSLRTRRINQRQMTVARVRTQNDQTVPVLLGTSRSLRNVNLRQGDQVTIIGQRVRLNRQPALKAQRIQANGRSYSLRQRSRGQQMNQYRQGQMGGQQGMQSQYQQGRMGSQRQTQLSGTIEQLKQVKIYGEQQPHAVAAISTRDGQTRVIDLGPADQVRDLDLQSGDRIQVRGTEGSINDNSVFIAHQVRAGGQSRQISRSWNRSDFRLNGQVVQTTSRTLPGDNRQHLVATVRTDRGSRYQVDLGPRQKLDQKNLDISQGQDITLIVQPSRSGNGQMLEAKKISTGDRVVQRNL